MSSNIYSSITVWLFFCIIGSFNVIGLIEGVKSVIEAMETKSHMAWATPLSLIISFAIAYLFRLGFGVSQVFGSDFNATIFGAVTIFSVGELFGYNVVVKWLFTIVDSRINSARVKAVVESEKILSGPEGK
jgi:hypothetical protein